eukprot:768291-Hanusia_phi.AAC.3
MGQERLPSIACRSPSSFQIADRKRGGESWWSLLPRKADTTTRCSQQTAGRLARKRQVEPCSCQTLHCQLSGQSSRRQPEGCLLLPA